MRLWGLIVALALAFTVAACGGDGDSPSAAEPASMKAAPAGAPDPAGCTARVDHRFIPLASLKRKVFEGKEKSAETGELVTLRSEQRVLARAATVGGYRAAVVQVNDFEDGELVERSRDYYTQCANGAVWYLGERVDDIEEGEIAGHEGQWLAGQNGAKPGLLMPAEPKVGQTFEPEIAPGVAEIRSKIISVDVAVTVPADTFKGCLKIEDYSSLDKVTEHKFYCPGVGPVREQGPGARVALVRYS